VTVPLEPGSVTLLMRFSKSHAKVVVFDPTTFVCMLPLLSGAVLTVRSCPRFDPKFPHSVKKNEE